jgi:prenyltransferase beta subunit
MEALELGEQDNGHCSFCGNNDGVMLIVEPDDPYLSTTICKICLIKILEMLDTFNQRCAELR